MTFFLICIGLAVGFPVGCLVGSFLAWRSAERALGFLHEEDAGRKRRGGQVLVVDFSGRHLPPAA